MRAASEKLQVEPSTISRQIGQLEKSLGADLIEKSRRKVKLTPAGKLTVDYYREIRTTEDTYLANLEGMKSSKSGSIMLAMGDAMITDSFLVALDRFVNAHRNVKIGIRLGGARQIVHSVVDDEAHFGLIFHVTTEPKISIRLSLAQPLHVIVNPAHRFAGRKSVEIREIAKEPLALPPASFQLRQIIHDAEREQGIFFDCALESESFSLLKWFARSGHGVTVLNRALVEDDLRAGKLAAVPVASMLLNSTKVSLITRAGRKLPILTRKFMVDVESYLRKSFQD
jgi:DNA-binding transcriptional LysR family regulator